MSDFDLQEFDKLGPNSYVRASIAAKYLEVGYSYFINKVSKFIDAGVNNGYKYYKKDDLVKFKESRNKTRKGKS